jgi:3-oxoacyl-[acyl-carrier-protein] synthase III
VILRPPVDRSTAVLFGDGAGACLVAPDAGLARIIDMLLCSDGAYAEDLHLDFDQSLCMNGRSVILQASRKIPRAVATLLRKHHRCAGDVAVFLMHQANQNLIVRIAEALGVSAEKFFSNIRQYGNTSSASMLIAAKEWTDRVGFRPELPVVFTGFGAGFHWGALLAEGC